MTATAGPMKLTAVLLLATAALVTLPAPAAAQAPVTSFDQVPTRVRVGDTVFVTDATGRQAKGEILDLSASSLTLRRGQERQEIPAAQVRTIEWQKPDSLKNGVLIGLGVGAALGFGAGAAGSQGAPGWTTVIGLIGAGSGALLGMGFDGLIPGKKMLIYRAASGKTAALVSVTPILTPRRQGVAVRVVF